jgi:hypothetical protein
MILPMKLFRAVAFVSVGVVLACCNNDDDLPSTPQLEEYSNFTDCPVDAEGNLNGYNFLGSALVRVTDDYPEDHFLLSTSQCRNFGAQVFLLLVSGRYDSISLGLNTVVSPRDSFGIAFSNLGETRASVTMRIDGGGVLSLTDLNYRLDKSSDDNFFVLDSVRFVDGDPQKRGGMWFGRFDLTFFLEDTPENKEGTDYARSIGIQVPEMLHYQDITFSAPTRVNSLEFNCGR